MRTSAEKSLNRRSLLSLISGVPLFAIFAALVEPVASLAQKTNQPTNNLLSGASQNARTDLLDDNLSHWYKWLGVPHFSVAGLPADTPKGDGEDGIPLGKNDSKNVFKVVTLNGEKVLSISGEIYCGIVTNREYENYHLRAEYKWGEKKHPPRPLSSPRDSGILFHLTGTGEDAHWSAFLMGLEYQVSEAVTADLLFMPNKDSTLIPVADARAFENSEGNRWDVSQSFKRVGGIGSDPKFRRSENYESSKTEWTTVEIYTVGGTGVFLVNGRVVNAFRNAGVPQPDKTIKPLTKGKIQIQSEGAEMYYRNITIGSISEIPAAIKKAAALE